MWWPCQWGRGRFQIVHPSVSNLEKTASACVICTTGSQDCQNWSELQVMLWKVLDRSIILLSRAQEINLMKLQITWMIIMRKGSEVDMSGSLGLGHPAPHPPPQHRQERCSSGQQRLPRIWSLGHWLSVWGCCRHAEVNFQSKSWQWWQVHFNWFVGNFKASKLLWRNSALVWTLHFKFQCIPRSPVHDSHKSHVHLFSPDQSLRSSSVGEIWFKTMGSSSRI